MMSNFVASVPTLQLFVLDVRIIRLERCCGCFDLLSDWTQNTENCSTTELPAVVPSRVFPRKVSPQDAFDLSYEFSDPPKKKPKATRGVQHFAAVHMIHGALQRLFATYDVEYHPPVHILFPVEYTHNVLHTTVNVMFCGSLQNT